MQGQAGDEDGDEEDEDDDEGRMQDEARTKEKGAAECAAISRALCVVLFFFFI